MADPVQYRKFKSDVIMNKINKEFITLKDEAMREYNVHLKTVLNTFIYHMKRDPLFKACYQRIAYVGSYYEGLKVGKPEEFDLNIIIKLPIDYKSLKIEIANEKAGYVKIKPNPDIIINLRKHVRWSEYKTMDCWFHENGYLNQNKFRQWFESVVIKALGTFEIERGKYVLVTNGKKYLLQHKKSGPALTLKIDVPSGHTLDIDIVPVLEFSTPPPPPFKSHNKKQNWFAISKPLEASNNNILWRPSFSEREAEFLKGSIKQVIRIMKKLRDTQGFTNIASYYIKALFLHHLERQKLEFQRWSITYLFFYMLQKLQVACAKHEIWDFWNPKNNLVDKISKLEMTNISGRLNNIIKSIDQRIANDPYVIAQFILDEGELTKLKNSEFSRSVTRTSLESRYTFH